MDNIEIQELLHSIYVAENKAMSSELYRKTCKLNVCKNTQKLFNTLYNTVYAAARSNKESDYKEAKMLYAHLDWYIQQVYSTTIRPLLSSNVFTNREMVLITILFMFRNTHDMGNIFKKYSETGGNSSTLKSYIRQQG